MSDSRLHDLLSAYLEGTTSEDQNRELLGMLRDSEEDREEASMGLLVDRLMREVRNEPVSVDLIMKALPSGRPGAASDAIMQTIERVGDAEAAPQDRTIPSRGRVFRRWIPLAAAASILVGFGILALRSPAGVRLATIESVTGEATILRGGRSLAAKPGVGLAAGDRLETSEGKLAIRYAGHDTTLELAGSSKLETANPKLGRLQIGSVTAMVGAQPAGQPFVLETPHARVTVMGTRFDLGVRAQASRVDVRDGRVRFAEIAGGAGVEVPAGCYSVAEPGEPLCVFPESADYAEVSRLRKMYQDGAVVFQDDFESGLKDGWRSFQAEVKGGVFGHTSAKDPARVGIVEAKLDGRTTHALRLDTGNVKGPSWGVFRDVSAKRINFSLEAKVAVRHEYPTGSLDLHIGGLTKPQDADTRLVAGLAGQPLASEGEQWIPIRMEYVLETDESGKTTADIKAFMRGRLSSWWRTKGSWESMPMDLYFIVGNGEFLLDDVIIRKLEPREKGRGLLALYLFNEKMGATVRDVSGVGDPMDLTIRKPEQARWMDNGLAVDGSAMIMCEPATKIADAWKKSGQLTYEFWGRAGKSISPDAHYGLIRFIWSKGSFCYEQHGILPDAGIGYYAFTLARKTEGVQMDIYAQGRHINREMHELPLSKVFSDRALGVQVPLTEDAALHPGIRTWTGECHGMRLHSRALSAEEIRRNAEAGAPSAAGRVTKGVLAVYRFNEGQGTTVRDLSGVGEPLNLTIKKPEIARWLDRGLQINGSAMISSGPATKMAGAWRKSNGLTFEFWTRITGSKVPETDYALMDIVWPQSWFNYTQLYTGVTPPDQTYHSVVVLTRKGDGFNMRSYTCGVLKQDRDHKQVGDLLANQPFTLRISGLEDVRKPHVLSWTGVLYHMTVYDRALSEDEVRENWEAGLPPATGRVTRDLLGFYRFNRHNGDVVPNLGPAGSAMDLRVKKPGLVEWTPDGVRVKGAAEIGSGELSAVQEAWRRTGGLTAEMWFRFPMETHPEGFDYVMGQFKVGRYDYSWTSKPAPPEGAGMLNHVVFTWSKEGGTIVGRYYSIGDLVATRDFRDMGIGLEQGPLRYVMGPAVLYDKQRLWKEFEAMGLAIYGRALTPEEIQRNWRETEADPSAGHAAEAPRNGGAQ